MDWRQVVHEHFPPCCPGCNLLCLAMKSHFCCTANTCLRVLFSVFFFLLWIRLLMFWMVVSYLELVVLQDGWLIYLHFTVCVVVSSRKFCFRPWTSETSRTARVSRCRRCIYQEQQQVVKDSRFRKSWLPLEFPCLVLDHAYVA